MALFCRCSISTLIILYVSMCSSNRTAGFGRAFFEVDLASGTTTLAGSALALYCPGNGGEWYLVTSGSVLWPFVQPAKRALVSGTSIQVLIPPVSTSRFSASPSSSPEGNERLNWQEAELVAIEEPRGLRQVRIPHNKQRYCTIAI